MQIHGKRARESDYQTIGHNTDIARDYEKPRSLPGLDKAADCNDVYEAVDGEMNIEETMEDIYESLDDKQESNGCKATAEDIYTDMS